MKIFGRYIKTSEIIFLLTAYIVINYAVIKLQQSRQTTRMNEETWVAAERARDVSGKLPEGRPLEQPRVQLAGPNDLNIPTEQPIHAMDEKWRFDDSKPHHVLGVDGPIPDPEPVPGQDSGEDFGDGEAYAEDEFRDSSQKLKTIVFWNTFFTSTDFRFGFGHQAFLEAKCPVHTCRTTNDRRQVAHADAVVFHGPRIEGFPPPQRPRGQIYAYVQQEPHYAMSQEELPAYKKRFNLTITHRADSDIHIPYGRVVYDEENIKKHPVHVSPQSRPKSVVWAASHCSTPSRREQYVKELQKYIDIDIYGSCGDLTCSKDDYLFCYSKFEKEYRFYMALENNYCKDYISEKVYRPLLYKMVPIVFGGGNYSQGTPPHSVIDISDFPNPKDLAKYLNYLSHNDKAYNKYFAWKSSGYELEHQRKVIMGDAFCRLCEILHDPNYEYKDYSDLTNWWVNGMCDAFTIQRWRRKNKW